MHLQIFPVNYTHKIFFSAPGVQAHPLHPLATPYAQRHSAWIHSHTDTLTLGYVTSLATLSNRYSTYSRQNTVKLIIIVQYINVQNEIYNNG